MSNDPDMLKMADQQEKKTMDERCVVCGHVGQDCRTLKLQYFYALEEASSKLQGPDKDKFYTVRTCKDCRADFIRLLRQWLLGQHMRPPVLDEAANIPVRVDGATVMMTHEQYMEYRSK